MEQGKRSRRVGCPSSKGLSPPQGVNDGGGICYVATRNSMKRGQRGLRPKKITQVQPPTTPPRFTIERQRGTISRHKVVPHQPQGVHFYRHTKCGLKAFTVRTFFDRHTVWSAFFLLIRSMHGTDRVRVKVRAPKRCLDRQPAFSYSKVLRSEPPSIPPPPFPPSLLAPIPYLQYPFPSPVSSAPRSYRVRPLGLAGGEDNTSREGRQVVAGNARVVAVLHDVDKFRLGVVADPVVRRLGVVGGDVGEEIAGLGYPRAIVRRHHGKQKGLRKPVSKPPNQSASKPAKTPNQSARY